MLIQDPPVPYAEISARLGIPVGSIGPTRGRCLDKLRRHPAIAALINAEAPNAELTSMPSQWCRNDDQMPDARWTAPPAASARAAGLAR